MFDVVAGHVVLVPTVVPVLVVYTAVLKSAVFALVFSAFDDGLQQTVGAESAAVPPVGVLKVTYRLSDCECVVKLFELVVSPAPCKAVLMVAIWVEFAK